jgi:hypothetical protein
MNVHQQLRAWAATSQRAPRSVESPPCASSCMRACIREAARDRRYHRCTQPGMAETLLVYTAPVRSSEGVEHEARARGRKRDEGDWEAWLDFEHGRGGATLRTHRETTQPDRAALIAWAHGLSGVYLEGALQRAVPGIPADGPLRTTARLQSTAEPEGVLDPFEVYAHGQTLLRRHLDGLSTAHLRHIARARDIVSARR